MEFNFVANTDSYKVGHPRMLVDGVENIHAYFESRVGAKYAKTMFIGLQILLIECFEGVQVTREKIEEASILAENQFGNPNVFSRKNWEYILTEHGGKLPLIIRAVPEGTLVGVSNALMTVEATDEKCAWLVTHAETLLQHVWAYSTVATISSCAKSMFKEFLNRTCDDGENFAGLGFMLHDFGMRGVTSWLSGAFEGVGHLANFDGTDTQSAMLTVKKMYGGKHFGMSIWATEHSIMTQHGSDGESKVVEHVFNVVPESCIISLVIDSYDYKNFVDNIIGKEFKEYILQREGVVVLRPDSGCPPEVVMYILNSLEKTFGVTVNDLGFKVLNSHIRTIWGDGINLDGINEILTIMEDNKWSSENIVFGMGGGLVQKIDRDTQRCAFKASAQKRDGVWHDVFKDPLDTSKASKKGRLRLFKMGGEFVTSSYSGSGVSEDDNYLKPVFENGNIIKRYTMDEIRDNTNK